MKQTVLVLAILFGALCIKSQNPQLDSLNSALKTAKHDTIRYEVNEELMNYYWQFNDFDKVLQYIDQNKAIALRLKDTTRLMQVYKAYGFSYEAINNINGTLEAYEAGRALAEKKNLKKQIMQFQTYISSLYRSQKQWNEALESYKKARSLAVELKDTSYLGIALINMGDVLGKLHKKQEALETYNQLMAIYKMQNKKGSVRFANRLIGIMFRENHDYKSALKYTEESLRINEELGDADYGSLLLGDISQIYFDDKNYAKAEDYILKALEKAKQINDQESKISTESYLHGELAAIYLKQNKISEAKKYGYLYLNSKSKLVTFEADLAEDYLLISQIDSAAGDGTKAYEHYKKYVSLDKQLKSEEVKQAAVKEKFKTEYEKQKAIDKAEQNAKDLAAQSELQTQKMLRNSFIAGFALVLILAILIFRSYKEKKKSNHILAEKNAEIAEKNKDIMDSITYARRIQTSLLPTNKYIDRKLNELKEKK